MNAKRPDGQLVVAENRKARHDYDIVETLEAGLVLQGTEVKSLRANQCQLRESYVQIRGGEAFIAGMHIAPYEQGNIANHDPLRERKLLLHAREISRLDVHVSRKGHTIVPLQIHFRDGRAKLLIGIAKGRTGRDKRAVIADRDAQRAIQRELKEHNAR